MSKRKSFVAQIEKPQKAETKTHKPLDWRKNITPKPKTETQDIKHRLDRQTSTKKSQELANEIREHKKQFFKK